MDAARRAFDAYAAAEPRLTVLWHMCRRAAPPAHANDTVDDAYDVDVYVTVRSSILPHGSEFGDRRRPAWHTEVSGLSTRREAS